MNVVQKYAKLPKQVCYLEYVISHALYTRVYTYFNMLNTYVFMSNKM